MAFASTATATQALTADKAETAAEAGRGLRSATHHKDDGKAGRHPIPAAAQPKTSRHIELPKRPL